MKKEHKQPEFTVIRQELENKKFFVASGGFTGDPDSLGGQATTTGDGGNLNI